MWLFRLDPELRYVCLWENICDDLLYEWHPFMRGFGSHKQRKQSQLFPRCVHIHRRRERIIHVEACMIKSIIPEGYVLMAHPKTLFYLCPTMKSPIFGFGVLGRI